MIDNPGFTNVYFSAVHHWDDYNLKIEVGRMETDQEFEDRKKKEQERSRKAKLAVEKKRNATIEKRKALYEELKKEFENS